MRGLNRLHGLLISVLLGLAGAAAADDYVRCVQEQLAALGYSPGAADGDVGPKTRAAVQALRKQRDQALWLRAMPGIEAKSARKWCRYLPIFDAELQRFQPVSLATPVETISAAGDVAQDLVEDLLNDVVGFYERRYGLRLTRQPAVVGGEESFGLAGMMRKHMTLRGWPVPFILNLDVAYFCRLKGGAAGLTHYDVIALCWDDPVKQHATRFGRWARRERADIGSVLAHEYMHHIQHVLTGAKAISPGDTLEDLTIGPAWMTEGTASYVNLEYWLENKSSFRRKSIVEQQKELNGSDLTLNRLRFRGSIRDGESYKFSGLAVDLLVRRYGTQTLFDYWRAIGRGATWDMAFETTYGMRIADYARMFPELLRNSQAAQDFADGG